ncbi:MAG TPA: DUF1559 domain-containing protein [Gemmataceae bacterium]|nr:DUF1559 domain-containing protein [Gemmataceae bacterium]
MLRLIPLLLPLVVLAPVGGGDGKVDFEGRARALAPYIDEQTIAVGRLDLTRPGAEEVLSQVALLFGDPESLPDSKHDWRRWRTDFTEAGGKEILLIFNIAYGPFPPAVVVPLQGAAKDKAVIDLLSATGMFPAGSYRRVGQAIVGGSAEARVHFRDLKAHAHPDLAKALATAGDTAAQFVLLLTPDQRRVIEEILPTLPDELGGGPSTVLTRGIRWAAIGVDGPPKSSLRLVVQSQDGAAARKLHDWLGGALKTLGRVKEVQRIFPNFEALAASLAFQLAGDRVTLTLDEKQVAALAKPLAEHARKENARAQSFNNLKQLVLALHNYHDTYKGFPTSASYDKAGKPLLSWRVHILPYIEQLALYQQFKLNEPWDSPHNKKLIPLIPKILRSPFSKVGKDGKTVYLGALGKDTMFSGKEKLQIRDVPDGTSNTIFLVEALDERAVIWTKPDELHYDPKQPHAGLVSKDRDWILTAFVDGSVRALPATIRADILRALFTRNGGEAIGDF